MPKYKNFEYVMDWLNRGVHTYADGDPQVALNRWRGLDAASLNDQIEGSITLLRTDRRTLEKAFKEYFGVPLKSITDFSPVLSDD